MAKARKFEKGQQLLVRAEVGVPWESATYHRRILDMRGWHSVRLEKPRYINASSGDRTTAEDPRGYLTFTICIPTQRIMEV